MSAVRKPSLSDPLSLDGLEPLLDQIFAPAVQNEFAPDVSTFERTSDLQARTTHVDFYAAEVGTTDSARNQLLTKQLTDLKEELKSFHSITVICNLS